MKMYNVCHEQASALSLVMWLPSSLIVVVAVGFVTAAAVVVIVIIVIVVTGVAVIGAATVPTATTVTEARNGWIIAPEYFLNKGWWFLLGISDQSSFKMMSRWYFSTALVNKNEGCTCIWRRHYSINELKSRTAKMPSEMQSEIKVHHTGLMSTQIMPLGVVLVLNINLRFRSVLMYGISSICIPLPINSHEQATSALNCCMGDNWCKLRQGLLHIIRLDWLVIMV